jgi:hypothetical protein
MAGNEITKSSDGGSEFQITLPVSQESFSNFIKDIIGGKNELKSGYGSPVLVDPDLLRSIVYAVKDRVTGQNHSDLVSTRIDVQYDNGRKYKTSDLEAAIGLSPVGDSKTTFIGIQLIFLVSYPNSSSPSREVVEVFFSENPKVNRTGMGIDFSDEVGSIRIRVEYTERSWSEDIVNLIERCLAVGADKYREIFPTRRIWFKQSRAYVATLGSILIVIAYCASVIYAYRAFSEGIPSVIEPTLAGISERVSAIQTQLSPISVTASSIIFIALGGSIVGAFIYMLDRLSSSDPLPSVAFKMFPPDERSVARYQKTLIRERTKGIFAFVGSIVSSIVAAILYKYFFG